MRGAFSGLDADLNAYYGRNYWGNGRDYFDGPEEYTYDDLDEVMEDYDEE